MAVKKRTLKQSIRRLLLGSCAGLGAFAQKNVLAADYYVSPMGADSNPGTLAAPFATLQKGADTAVAGDTVYIRGGTYEITTPKNSGAGLTFSKSGTSDTNRIKYWAYQNEVPVFDFANMVISTSGYTHGFVVTGSWLHFRGLELRNVPMNSYSNNAIAANGGGECIFELLNLHHNSGNGIFIGKGTGGDLILNCDAHDNYDATSNQGDGQNADGFGVHYQTSGATTIVRGCRAWWNSDDGYDLINQEVPVTIENSWAMGNGYIKSGTARPKDGNGNGFKAGSSKTGVRHVIRGSLAWKNVASGFYANHSSGGNDWFNNTSYNNGTQYNMLASDPNDSSVTIILTGMLVHKMRNNIGFPNKNTNMMGVDTGFNSWDLGITPAAADFVSVMDTDALGPRQADGSLPNVDFMKLPAGSKLIDKGTDVGLSYAGAAPDLGAFEFGAKSVGTGGSSGGPSPMGGAAPSAAAGAPGKAGAAPMSASGGSVAESGSGPSGGDSTAPSAGGNGESSPDRGGSGSASEPPSPAPTNAGGCGCNVPGVAMTSLLGVIGPFAPLLGALAILRQRRRAQRAR
ncbi:MAG TPA: right-handed parallel beta-helix repeat-containing protein [Polyangiaceae bacterium]|nr:right-handed parallel beta-helix repeat-containing protein [Polyangiaceae bacterium]